MRPDNFCSAPQYLPCRVSVVIQALNEERHICAAIESALCAVSAVGGEVVLADAHSTDRTVELAQAYPVRIVQLRYPQEQRCGIGPQLGFQHSYGEFIYLLDGDMEILPGFLGRALSFMASHPEAAGVGGHVLEQNTAHPAYAAQSEGTPAHSEPGSVDRLDGGGLYRRSAIAAAGYFSDRNLHSYEEFDLAVRLRSLGWKLWHLPINAVHHFGHDTPAYTLLLQRWNTGHLCGLGELIRASAGRPCLRLVIQDLHELHLYLAVLGWWALLLSAAFWPLPETLRLACFSVLFIAPPLFMAWRKRSFSKALYSVVSCCFNTAGLLRGLLQHRQNATTVIASQILKEPTGLSWRQHP